MTFENNLREVVSEAVEGVLVSCAVQNSYLITHVCWRAVSMHFTRVLKSCSMHKFCQPCSIVLSCGCRFLSLIRVCWLVLFAVRKGCAKVLCCLRHRRKGSTLCLLYKIYHRADHPVHKNLHHFVAVHNTRASAALCELALMIPRSRTDQFNRAYLLVAVRMWNLLPSDVLSGGTLSSFKSAMNLSLQKA